MTEALSLIVQRAFEMSSKSSYLLLADVLKSCATISNANSGKILHSHVIKQGHCSCQFILKALLNMYAKCKALEDCRNLFEEINCPDTVTWNIILSGLAGTGTHDYKVMGLFNMLCASRDPKPSTVTLAIVLPICARFSALDSGKSIHAYAVKSGMESQTLVSLGISLLRMHLYSCTR